jgi:hypothetical protein
MPTLDSASALKRAYERTIGTILGALFGLAIGFVSLILLIDTDDSDDVGSNTNHQAIFLGVTVSLTCFLFAYFANKNGYGKSYSAILTIITYSIAAYSFFEGSSSDTTFDHPWQVPCWRSLNIIIGCMIGSVCSLVLWPVSAKSLIETQVNDQGMAVAKSAQSVLKNADDTLSGRTKLPAYDDIVRRDSPVSEDDEAYTLLMKNMERWKDCKAMFPLLRWDPYFQLKTKDEDRKAFQKNMTYRLRRLFCIQTTIMCMDGIVRTGLRYDESFATVEDKILKDLESTISVLLDNSKCFAERETAAKTLLTSHLKCIRNHINEARERVSQLGCRVYIPSFRDDMPLISLESQELHVLFFLLAESLIVRSVRLCFFCNLPSYGRRAPYERAMIVDTSKLFNHNENLKASNDTEIDGLRDASNGHIIKEEAIVHTNNAMLEQKKIAEEVQKRLEGINSTDGSSSIDIKIDDSVTEMETSRNQQWWKASEMLRLLKALTAYDHDSFVFAIRFTATVTVCSLFIFCYSSSYQYPYSLWVVTSAQIVSWAPAVDTSTAIQKGIDRSFGTIIGAVIGLLVGYLSIFLSGNSYVGQALILGLSTSFTGFFLMFFAKYVGFPSQYAATLGTTTFGYVSLTFYAVDTSSAWKIGAFRSSNECLGAMIASLICILLWPTSTCTSLKSKVTKQLDKVGKSASSVLESAHDVLCGMSRPPSFDELLEQRLENSETSKVDEAYDSYMKCLDGWKSCQALLPFLRYDPFHHFYFDKDEKVKFRESIDIILGRCLRIQAVLSMIDIIIRTGIHDARMNSVEFDNHQNSMHVVKDIGSRVEIVLDFTKDEEERNEAAQALLQNDLIHVRDHLKSVNEKVADSPFRLHIPRMYSGMPDLSLDTQEQVALFFQLLELLVIRVVRLHYYCQMNESTIIMRNQ